MKRYDEYKDSGVEWIGEVPSHWEVCKLKHIAKINGRVGYKGYTTADLVPEGQGAYTIGGKHITNCVIDLSNADYISWEKYYESPEIMVRKGDLLMAQRGSLGKVAFVEKKIGPATINPSLVLLNHIKVDGKFLYYSLMSDNILTTIGILNTATAVPMISQNQIENMAILFPRLSEQTAIANYLDKKCSEIDNVISAQQKRIALLQELKQSVITHAVTKGLNPNVEMKDSGVEWIGKVPKTWEVAPIKRYAKIFTGNTPSTKIEKYYDSEDINWFTPGDFYKDTLIESAKKISEVSRKENACRMFPPKSVYMIGIGGTIGKIATCEEEASANQQINIIVPNANTDYKYLAYCVRCQKEEIILSANVVTLPIINQDKTGYLFMPHPQKTEQNSIVNYLDKKCASIDSSISKAQHQVELLQEYKQSLITEVVTGKRKVL